MSPCDDGSTLVDRWLYCTKHVVANHEREIHLGTSDAKRALKTASELGGSPDIDAWLYDAGHVDFVLVHPEWPTQRRGSPFAVPKTSAQKAVNYWINRDNVSLLEQAVTDLRQAVRERDCGTGQYTKAVAELVYARTELLMFRLWRSHALRLLQEYDLSDNDYTGEAKFARRVFSEVMPDRFPQESALISYCIGRILEWSGDAYLREALEFYLFAISFFHEARENGQRIFNAPRFIPHQNEFWRCVSSAIRLALITNQKGVAIQLSQLSKFSRSPLSVLGEMGFLEFIPERGLFPNVLAQTRDEEGGRHERPVLHDPPPVVAELWKCVSDNTAIFDIHRSDDGLLMMLVDKKGVHVVECPMEQFYLKTRTGLPFRFVEPSDIDVTIDEQHASWSLSFPSLAVSPRPERQWEAYMSMRDFKQPFTGGLDAMAELYNIFFKNLDTYLLSQGITKLAVSADGGLGLIPFAALIDGNGRFLVDRYAFSYAPNLSTLLWCLSNSRETVRSAVLVADFGGTLALAADEVTTAMRGLAPAEAVLVSQESDTNKLMNDFASADFLHFACHAAFDSEDPEKSGLVVGPYHFISATAVSEHGLRLGSLVILSACETARSKVSAKYGVPGLPYAFLRAGATTVLCSLWKVPDVAAYLLMSKFYELLFHSQPLPDISEALAGAQRWLKNLEVDAAKNYPGQAHNFRWGDLIDREIEEGTRFSHFLGDPLSGVRFLHFERHPDLTTPFANPFYWAGFMVIGDWRGRKTQ